MPVAIFFWQALPPSLVAFCRVRARLTEEIAHFYFAAAQVAMQFFRAAKELPCGSRRPSRTVEDGIFVLPVRCEALNLLAAMSLDKDSLRHAQTVCFLDFRESPPSDEGLATPGCRLLSVVARVTLTMKLRLSMDAGRQLQCLHQRMREGSFGCNQLMTLCEVSGFRERSNTEATSWTWAGA